MTNKDNPVPSIDIKNRYILQIKQAISELNKEGIECYFDEKSLVIQNGVETNNEQPKCTDRCDCNFFLKNLELCPECDSN